MPGQTRSILAISCAALLGVACSSADLDTLSPPVLGAALDDHHTGNRTVTVYLVADRAAGYIPNYADRILFAEPVVEKAVVTAQARTTVQGIDTVIIGESCAALTRNYSALHDCEEVDTISRYYGDYEATAATDTEGFASLSVGDGSYRISAQSWVTIEDQKCSWGGSEIISSTTTTLELPILVYCE